MALLNNRNKRTAVIGAIDHARRPVLACLQSVGWRQTIKLLVTPLVVILTFSLLVLAATAKAQPSSEAPALSTVEANGTRLAYLEQGRGDPIVLVHGTLADYRAATPLIPPLSRSYRVITYSRRYHHPNAVPREGIDGADYAFGLHAQDLAAMIKVLSLGRVHVIGHSTGAITALLLARDNPQLVRTLVLGEPGLRSLLTTNPKDVALMEEELSGTIRPAQEALRRDDLLAGVRAFIDGRNGRAGVFDQLPPPVRARLMENAPALKAELVLGPGLPGFTCSDAYQVRQPALLLIGQRSLPFFHRISEELSRCLPNARTGVITGVPHGGIFSGNVEEAAKAIFAFLDSRPGG